MAMFNNQYLICDNNLNVNGLFDNFKIVNFENLRIMYHQNLSCSIGKNNCVTLLVLGFIIDPLNPEHKNEDIINNIMVRCKDIGSFIKEIQNYSGRFVALVKDDTNFYVVTDACALRQAYYTFHNASVVISSSPKIIFELLQWIPQINKQTFDLINSDDFKKAENPWWGDTWYDDRVKKVLPNHCLDILNKRTDRLPLYPSTLNSERDILEYAKAVLSGSLIAANRRHEIIQPLTAGWDTRMLLAASKCLSDKIKYYVFIRNKNDINTPDAVIPQRLAKRLNINFSVVCAKPITQDFLSKFEKEHFYPRILPKTADIQWHYYNNKGKNILNINGNCTAIIRCVYGTHDHINLSIIKETVGFNKFFFPVIENWYKQAKQYSKKYNINLLDLFYWEHRMGNWGAHFPFEQDIAIEEYSPFNHKNLLLSVLRIEKEKRKRPHYIFFSKLIGELWPEALKEPCNPIFGFSAKKRIGTFIKDNDILYSLYKKLRQF